MLSFIQRAKRVIKRMSKGAIQVAGIIAISGLLIGIGFGTLWLLAFHPAIFGFSVIIIAMYIFGGDDSASCL